MAQQNLVIGAADAKAGDTYFNAFTKTQANFVELYANLASQAQNVVIINSESDFPTQDATTITCDANTKFFIGAAFTTSKVFVMLAGSSIESIGPFSLTITYSGTGTMFTSSTTAWSISRIRINCSLGTIFNITGPFIFLMNDIQVLACANIGTFTASGAQNTIVINNSAVLAVSNQGITLFGAFGTLAIGSFFATSTLASNVMIDLGTATFRNMELSNLEFSGIAGSVGLKGLASSANIAAGAIAGVSDCNMTNDAMVSLSGITNKDIRFSFSKNGGIPDTIEDALVSLTNNATETVITTINTPVKLTGIFVVERESHFTSDTTGKMIYNGERDVTVPIDITVTAISASGTNKDIHTYLALNGSVITNSGMKNRVGATDPGNTSIAWQATLSQNDYLEIYIENNTDTVNLIGEDAALRVR
jgi:hypothetical protein